VSSSSYRSKTSVYVHLVQRSCHESSFSLEITFAMLYSSLLAKRLSVVALFGGGPIVPAASPAKREATEPKHAKNLVNQVKA
jgi:hypothetical protein